MAASKKRTNTSKNKNSKFTKLLVQLNPFSPKRRFLTFIIVFAIIGGGYFVYRSFAATQTPFAHLRNSNTSGASDISFAFGDAGDSPVACNWDGSGADGFGVRRDSNVTFYLSETLTPPKVTRQLAFGNHGDKPVCGDWDGDGKAGVGVFRPAEFTWYLSDKIEPNAPIKKISFGDPKDIPIACDWDGNGKTDIGVYRPSNSTFYLSYSTLGRADKTIPFGNPGDLPVCGDWNGDKKAGIGVYRPGNARFYLSDTIDPSRVNYEFMYGNGAGDTPIVGDWNGDGKDTVGVYRMGDAAKPSGGAAPKGSGYTCVGDTVITVKDKATCDAILNYARIGREQAAQQPPAPIPVAVTNTSQLLSRGATGGAVSSLQQRLANRGFWIGVTGTFDNATEITVRSFQSVRGIGVDGVVGPQTYGQLAAAESEGWVFNPNDPRLDNPAVRAVPVFVDRTTNIQTAAATAAAARAAGLTAEAINTYFALLRAAEISAQQRAIAQAAEIAAQRARNDAIARATADQLASQAQVVRAVQNLRVRAR